MGESTPVSMEGATVQNGFRKTVRGALNISRAGTIRCIRRALTARRQRQVLTPPPTPEFVAGEGSGGVNDKNGRLFNITAPVIAGGLGLGFPVNRLRRGNTTTKDSKCGDGEERKILLFTEDADKDIKAENVDVTEEQEAKIWWQRKMSKKERRKGLLVSKESLFCIPKFDTMSTGRIIDIYDDDDEWEEPDTAYSRGSSPVSPRSTSPGISSHHDSGSDTTADMEDPVDSLRWSFITSAPALRRKSMKRKESADGSDVPEPFSGQLHTGNFQRFRRRGSTISSHTFGVRGLEQEGDVVRNKTDVNAAPFKRRKTLEIAEEVTKRSFLAVVDAEQSVELGPHPCANVACKDTLESILSYHPARSAFEEFIKSTKQGENEVAAWMAARAYRLATEYTRGLMQPIGLLHEETEDGRKNLDRKIDEIEESAKTKMATESLLKYVDEVIEQVEASATAKRGVPDDRRFRKILEEAEAIGLCEAFCITEAENDDGPIVMVSDGFHELTGYDREETLLKEFEQDSPRTPTPVSPADVKSTTDLLMDRKKDGSRFYNLVFTAPLYMLGSGEVLYKLNALVDVTRLVRQEVANRVLFGDGNECGEGREVDAALGSAKKRGDADLLRRLEILDKALKRGNAAGGTEAEALDSEEAVSGCGGDGAFTTASGGRDMGPRDKCELGEIVAWLKWAYGQFFVIAPSAHYFVMSFVSPALEGFSADMQGSEVSTWIEFHDCTEVLKKLQDALNGREKFSVAIKWGRRRDGKILRGVPLFTADQDSPFAWVCLLLDVQ
ncbi:hypothetical protein RUND412_003834 [Rhizina undulata]